MTLESTATRLYAPAILGVLVALSLPGVALAQPTFTEGAAAAPASTDDMDLTLNAGGMLNYGNANAGGLNVSGNFTVREGMELFVAEASYVWGIGGAYPTCAMVRAADPLDPAFAAGRAFCDPGGGMPAQPDGSRAGGLDWRENASNLNWRLRFDHFFDADNAFFVAHRGRVDYFAGLDLRLGLQLGYNRMLFREENHTLAMDVGVDATVDIYSENVRAQNQALLDMGTSLPNLANADLRFIPALRVQLAYVNHLNAALTYDTTFEVLWDMPNPDHFRFEWANHLRSAVDTWLQVSLDVTFRLDSLPPGQAVSWNEAPGQPTTMFDMLTTLNLVGNLDLDGEPPTVEEVAEAAAACPEVTCPDCPVCADCPEPAPVEAAPAEAGPAEAAPAPAAAEAPPA
jgi:hypothetical protein